MRTRTILLLTLFILALQIYCENPRRYITQNGSGLRDGSSWENAGGAEDLQDILDLIQDADFWIARGIYKPNRFVDAPEDERDMAITAHWNYIYGGFAGNETDLSQRDIKANETIFSGDIGIEGDNSDNSYHVMKAVQILDGVTICNGNANGSYNPNYYGGGVYVYGSQSVFRNCTFRDNYASSRGGAVLMDTWGYDVTFENCLFYNNEATYGGAIYSRYDLSTINNCTFVNNTAENGGGIYIVETDESKFLITNNIFWQNSVNHIRIYNSANFSYTVSHNAIEGGYEGFANINLSSENAGFKNSPYFTDPDNHDYSLQSPSPCIDAGVYWNASCETDITGQLRPQGKGWDIGAYEYNSGPLTSVPPTVSTLSPEFTTVSTARVRGNVADDGGSQMVTKGVYYGTYSGFDPETEGTFVKYNEIYYEGEFYIDITNLLPGTTYFYRIFCENRVGTAVGEEMDFTTGSGVKPDVNGILYAKPDGTGDGSSWANALHGNDLQLGINEPAVTEIWLAQGKYLPTSWPCTQLKSADFEVTDDFAYKLQEDSLIAKGITEFKMNGTTEREKHFMLRANLSVYGGFTGTETSLEQRDFRTYKTILSGDIGADGEYYDNAFHVIYHYYNPDVDSTTILDGVTISDGNANGTIMGDSSLGGGMFNRTSSPTIRNCVFENNRAVYGGGVMNGYSGTYGPSKPVIYNTMISNNTASNHGGGIYNISGYPVLTNCAITNNHAVKSGGGVYHYADYFDFGYKEPLNITHCTIAGNESPQGSQLVLCSDRYNETSIHNSVIWGSGENILWLYTNLYTADFPIYTSMDFCALTEDYPNIGEGNILLSSDNAGDPESPYFNYPENNDYSIQYDSACKDMAIYLYATKEDIYGVTRPQGAAYDMGACEFETADPAGEVPVIQTKAADGITSSTAVCHADILSSTGGNLTVIGASVSETDGFDPEVEGVNYYYIRDISGNQFSALVSELKPETQYYFRPYAENRIGYSYGQQDSFMTAQGVSPDEIGIVYVKSNGTGDGSSWENALNGNDLQTAIDHDSTKQVWVAKGVYKPNSWPTGGETEREMHFGISKNIALYGGFAGNETDISERSIKENETLLSGDVGIEDYVYDNSNYILYNRTLTADSATVVIDGFTFEYGYEDRVYYYYSPVTLRNYRSIVSNCIFRNNFCDYDGGALYIDSRTAIVDNCEFFNNQTRNWGGSLFLTTYDITINNSKFQNNISGNSGGAIGIEGFYTNIKNCLFYSNTSDAGWAIGILDSDYGFITNCTFANNKGDFSYGNSIYTTRTPYLEITNCAMWNGGDEVYNCSGESKITNSAYIGDFQESFIYEGIDNIILSPNNAGDPNSPYFSDPDRNHWWIQEASPLRNVGIWTDDVLLYDIVGYLRDDYPDIGCYEYDPSSIGDNESSLPITTKLYQNYPNPFNPATNIKFSLSKAGKVELKVYNVLGQMVTKLVEDNLKAGNHSVVFNADALNSGVYYYSLEADGKSLTKRMLMVK